MPSLISATACGQLWLGGPVWAHAGWRGKLFPSRCAAADFLAHYARVFNAVEGNNTFYASPSAAQIANWRAATPERFRFCFKLPRQISHDLMLQNASAETQAFLALIAPLAQRLGPIMIQLGPSFAPAHLPVLADYLDRLSKDFDYAVEVRHPDFFVAANENALDALLRQHKINRCHFDTESVHRIAVADRAVTDASTIAAITRKPKVPKRDSVTATMPVVRVVGQNQLVDVQTELDYWTPRVVDWLRAGSDVHLFAHTPDDGYAVDYALRFNAAIRAELPQIAAMALPETQSLSQGDLFA